MKKPPSVKAVLTGGGFVYGPAWRQEKQQGLKMGKGE
jgi:hypothetical protein